MELARIHFDFRKGLIMRTTFTDDYINELRTKKQTKITMWVINHNTESDIATIQDDRNNLPDDEFVTKYEFSKSAIKNHLNNLDDNYVPKSKNVSSNIEFEYRPNDKKISKSYYLRKSVADNLSKMLEDISNQTGYDKSVILENIITKGLAVIKGE